MSDLLSDNVGQQAPSATPKPVTQKKIDPIQVFIANDFNNSNANEPSKFTVSLPTDGGLYNFGDGNSQPALIKRTVVLATHISHNNSKFNLSIAGSGKGNPPGDSIKAGQPVPLSRDKNGQPQKVDIAKWTIMANPNGT